MASSSSPCGIVGYISFVVAFCCTMSRLHRLPCLHPRFARPRHLPVAHRARRPAPRPVPGSFTVALGSGIFDVLAVITISFYSYLPVVPSVIPMSVFYGFIVLLFVITVLFLFVF